MHVPDGFLDARTALVTGGLAAAALGQALRRARAALPPRRVPLLGLAAAFVFVAQVLNFPVMGGTSGHLVGAVLVAVLLGPDVAVIVMAAVLLVQCLMFADGGVTALGANFLNMGVVGGVGGWAIYRVVHRLAPGARGRVLAAGFAAWSGTVLAAATCAGELAVAGTVALAAALPAMAGIHMLVGVAEGLVTALVVASIARIRPDLLDGDTATERKAAYGAVAIYGALVALALALFLSPLASAWPDGLEGTAKTLGFADRATAALPAPMSEYRLPGVFPSVLGTALAAFVGTLVAFVLAVCLARVLVPPGSSRGRE